MVASSVAPPRTYVSTGVGFRAFQTNKNAVAVGPTLSGVVSSRYLSTRFVRSLIRGPASALFTKKRGGYWSGLTQCGVFGLSLDVPLSFEHWHVSFRALFKQKKISAVAIGITLLNPACSN